MATHTMYENTWKVDACII